MNPTERDELHNAILATGGLAGALMDAERRGRVDVEVVVDAEGNATNRLRVRFPFLKSPYLVTVEREASS